MPVGHETDVAIVGSASFGEMCFIVHAIQQRVAVTNYNTRKSTKKMTGYLVNAIQLSQRDSTASSCHKLTTFFFLA